MLSVKNLECGYGRLTVIWNLDMIIEKGSVGLFGPNGAGKTTLINAILGMVKVRKGEIVFNGANITGMKTHLIARKGISLVPQERELFPYMTVRQNLDLGAAYIPGAEKSKEGQYELVFSLFPILKERLTQLVGTMSGGQQRMVAIARALMAKPKLLILDEPSLGLQPSLVTEVFDKLVQLKQSISILLTEQNVRESLKAIDNGYLLENGRISLSDSAQNLGSNPYVIKSYLGI